MTSDALEMEKEKKQCNEFFEQPLPVLIKHAALSFNGCYVVDTSTQYIERLCLLCDLVSTECFKEVTCLPEQPHPITAATMKK